MRTRTLLLATLLSGFGMAGCSVRLHTYGYATVAPPPLRMEVYDVAPRPGFVWIGGYWRWAGSDYAWTPGRWVRPPRRGAVWAPGYWEHRNDRYRWHEGRWR